MCVSAQDMALLNTCILAISFLYDIYEIVELYLSASGGAVLHVHVLAGGR